MENSRANSTGSRFSDQFVERFSNRTFREVFVTDQIRSRVAMMIRALREERGWSQKVLGEKMGKPQSVVSRLEDPNYGKLSVQTLFEVAAAFNLPLLIDLPQWEDWFVKIRDFSDSGFSRRSFDPDYLKALSAIRSPETNSALLSAAYSQASATWQQQRSAGTQEPLGGIANARRAAQSIGPSFLPRQKQQTAAASARHAQ